MTKVSRREVLTTMAMAGGATALGSGIPGWLRVSMPEAAPLGAADFKALTDLALGHARARGCAYAAVRISRQRHGAILRRVPSGSEGAGLCLAGIESERVAFTVRVVHSGRWGLAEGSALYEDEVARTTARAIAIARADGALVDRPSAMIPDAAKPDCWITPHDPFDRPLDDRLASLAPNNPSAATFTAEEAYYASSKGAFGHSTELALA